MVRYTTQSLDELKSKVDLVDVLSRHMELKKAGAAHKGCCPFHDEKSPSFMVRAGDRHYHCFGCGAHGDAISFLMEYSKLTFQAAIEQLAERYNVTLVPEEDKGVGYDGTSRVRQKELLEKTCQFFHSYFLQSEEASEPLEYLLARGFDLNFIRMFRIGYAPRQELLRGYLKKEGFSDDDMQQLGVLSKPQSGAPREFFQERIVFPILDSSSSVIGFSARKWKEATFGGKYINTPETPLFKKSRVLFGLAYSRRRLAKEKTAIIVEGQLDCLRLIEKGLDCTVAALGTAFGEGHAQELKQLGVTSAYLLFDGDPAGKVATHKVGHILQKMGIEPFVVQLPEGEDPDSLVRKHGVRMVMHLLAKAMEFLQFLVEDSRSQSGWKTPSEKMRQIQEIVQKIYEWGNELLIHESLKRLADLSQIPKSALGLQDTQPRIAWKGSTKHIENTKTVDVLEEEVVRWLLLEGANNPSLVELCKANLQISDFKNEELKALYCAIMEKGVDLIELSKHCDNIDALLTRKVNRDKAKDLLGQTVLKIKERSLFEEREVIRQKLSLSNLSDEEALQLAKRFDLLKSQRNPTLL